MRALSPRLACLCAAMLLGCLARSAAAQADLSAALEVFAPGVVSLEGASVYRGAFGPGGDSFYFFRKVTPRREDYRVFVTRLRARRWSTPARLFQDEASDLYPAISPDGRRMVFSSYRRLPNDTGKANANLWYADRAAGGWSVPRPMTLASTPANYDAKPVFRRDGAVHFISTLPDWRTKRSLVTRWNGEAYGPPEVDDGPGISSAWRFVDGTERYLWDVVLSPDGSLAVLEVSDLVQGHRQPSDLWVAFRQGDGWSAARPLTGVNTPGTENFPVFSPDGRYLLFDRDFATYYRIPVAIIRRGVR